MSNIVPDRPVTYDETKFWDEDAGTWTGTDAGGSRYKAYLVVIGSDASGDGVIYFG